MIAVCCCFISSFWFSIIVGCSALARKYRTAELVVREMAWRAGHGWAGRFLRKPWHVGITLALIVGAAIVPVALFTGPARAPRADPGVSVPVTAVLPKQAEAKNGTKTPFKATELSWPQPQVDTVSLRPGVASPVGSSPVWVEPRSAALSAAKVRVLPHSVSKTLGVSGVVMSVTGNSTGKVLVGLGYKGFGQEFGGNYGSRLSLVELPACALTTPDVGACRKQTPVGAVNDPKSQVVTADVSLAGSALVLAAATADPGTGGGSAGSYAATSLKPAESWNQGGDSGSFDYSYPITLPGASSSLTPPVSLSYSSQGVDGQTSVAQAQSSWVGDGWDTPDSFVEQTFTTCSDSPEGVTLPSAESTGDECYDGPILTVSLNGSATSLVCNADETSCTKQADDGATVTHVTGSGNGSGTYNTDYWVITERSGTKYYFGLNELPGYASGDRSTNSVDSEPVYSDAESTDPCYGDTNHLCTMAYRWHLDYVTNPTGQAMAYYYTQAANYYGEDNGASDVSYIRDSYLSEIDYGFAAGAAYSTSVPVADKVIFTPNGNGRCVAASCTPLTSSSMTATLAGTEYPDVPYDLICASGAACTSDSPSFFSTARLASITTEQYSAATSAYQDVDSYALTQTEPQTGDTTDSTLWLASVQHTGDDTSAGGSASPVSMPSVTFGGIDLPNRVDTANFPGLYRYRLDSITSELGSVTSITYGTPDACTDAYVTAQTATTAASNTDSCYPVYWTPAGYSAPVMDWFESYAVTQVIVSDTTGGGLPEETDYTYGGGAAWHYDDNEVVKAKYRTYGQFRGYATVTTYTGQAANNPQTEEVGTYYRGMDGDYLSASSTRSVKLTDSRGGTHTDSGPLAGDVLESRQNLGAGGPLESDAITSYWVSGAVRTRARTGLPALAAQATAVAESWASKTDSDGGETGASTVTETDNTYDSGTSDADFGLVEYSYAHTDPVNAAYDSCTTTEYAPANTSLNLVGLVDYSETDSVACSGYTADTTSTSMPSGFNMLSAPSASAVDAPLHVKSATETFYDDPAFGTTFPPTSAPGNAEMTMARKASGYASGAFTWQTGSRDTYDGYGRVADAYDADGNETVTGYTVNSVGLTTGETVTQPSTSGVAHVTSETIDPTRDQTLTSTDENGVVVTERYDALGRLTAVWKDSRPTSDAANTLYSYTVSNSTVSGATTQTLNDEGGYNTSVTIDDSLGRVRQTQAPTPQGGRLISDTFYDSRGWVYKKNTNYWDSTTTPTVALVSVADNVVADQDDYVLDGLGRVVEDESQDDANIVSTTTTVYNGDETTVIPPSGGAVKTTMTDPLGRTTKLTEYTANPAVVTPSNAFTGVWYITGGTPTTTSYGYDWHGNQDSTTDAAGDQWTQAYNLLGRQASSTDADAGTTTMTYDPDGNLLQSRDADGNYVSYVYDALGRKIAEYGAPSSGQVAYTSGSSPGNELGSWVYDNANDAISGMTDPVGQVTTQTSYSGGYAYTEQSLGFNVFGESEGTSVTIPSAAQGSTLGKTWTIDRYYTATTGLPEETKYPSGGGLPAEDATYTYTTALDLPSGVGSGLAGYAQSTSYTDLGQVEQAQIGGTTDSADITDTYDPHTGLLTNQLVTRSAGTPNDVDEVSYDYDPDGLTTSETDTRLGSSADSETQCFTYTTQDQLSAAWTATDGCDSVPTTASYSTVGDALGTSSAYWEAFTYNSAGDRASETSYNASTGGISTTAYAYNGNAMSTGSQPTTLTSATTTGASTGSTTDAYYGNGEQETRTTASGAQTLTWNGSGELTSVAAGSTTDASYIYDAGGNLLLQTDTAAGTTTLYLPGEQITYDSAAGTFGSDRYYALPGGATAVRTGAGDNYDFEIASDQHGTNLLSLDYTAQVPTWRQFDPFGNTRGTAVTWADNRGFLDKVSDAATALTDIGARWYDPVTGSFASVDPVLEVDDPTQLGGYDSGGNDPVSASDPTGDAEINGGGCVGSIQYCTSGGRGNGDGSTTTTSTTTTTSSSSSSGGGCWGPGGEWLCGSTGNNKNSKGTAHTSDNSTQSGATCNAALFPGPVCTGNRGGTGTCDGGLLPDFLCSYMATHTYYQASFCLVVCAELTAAEGSVSFGVSGPQLSTFENPYVGDGDNAIISPEKLLSIFKGFFGVQVGWSGRSLEQTGVSDVGACYGDGAAECGGISIKNPSTPNGATIAPYLSVGAGAGVSFGAYYPFYSHTLFYY